MSGAVAAGAAIDQGHDDRPVRRGAGGSTDWFLGFCRCINALAGLSCLLCLFAHGLAVAVGPSFNEQAGTKVQVLRCFGVLISGGLALIETEWQFIASMARIFENWLGRGLAQAFLAVFTLELANSDGSDDFDKSVLLYRNVAGICMLSCAGFYIFGGLMCIGVLKQARYRRVMERVRVERDLEVIEKQREELQGLLAAYSKV